MNNAAPVSVKDNRPDRTKPLPQYEPFTTLMDRIAVKRIVQETAPEGFIVAEQYRQHTNVGIVVCVGDFAVIGGKQVSIQNILKTGDKVWYGEYNSEKFEIDNEELELVRIQDVRGVARLRETQ